ncbi:hypothetical protein IQ06DRAFT_211592 [Phaeosphaeriaceae sp. SRC1lsM3a]|nr:hypothetical protein IQ06DRAFT_211592 [Stagonospora sp. SRC1lsM3a]
MNFVDVQPHSFLDYAYTSPSSTVMSAPKPSKTSRKQNRCCDQCRKGKRACDAAILEDALLDEAQMEGNAATFHYSDIFGALASCSNCQKTKKLCTFEWLRSQRVSQSKDSPAQAGHPAKRRRTSSEKSSAQDHILPQRAVQSDVPFIAATSGDFLQYPEPPVPHDVAFTFADFTNGVPGVVDHYGSLPPVGLDNPMPSNIEPGPSEVYMNEIEMHSTKSSSLDMLSDRFDGEEESPQASSIKRYSNNSPAKHSLTRRFERKRPRSRTSSPYGPRSCPAASLTSDLVLSTNNAVLADRLLKLYHNTFEQALSCWATERTCPYGDNTDRARADDVRPNWNQIYHRVFRLDRVATNIRGRQLTFSEDRAVAQALNLAILAFATQGAQSNERYSASYPFDGTFGIAGATDNVVENKAESEVDRLLPHTAWNDAQNALHAAREIESFRLVLAQFVFSLTQKPVDEGAVPREAETKRPVSMCDEENAKSHVAEDMDECGSLLAKLNIAIDAEGPPTHLEHGLRLIHSLRSRMIMQTDTAPGLPHTTKRYRPSTGQLDEADRATVDLLFWLGIMFDTLSSAMRRRPLVVSDGDSDIYPELPSETTDGSLGLWDTYLFARQQRRIQDAGTRWPCSFDQAAAILCDAAPVKVLLFRKITRIQTLITRRVRSSKIEHAIKAALEVHAHWETTYAPFVQDCIDYHDQLHPHIQSWYTCLAGHWHLASLLLADLIEVVLASRHETVETQSQSAFNSFVVESRVVSCRLVSDMATRACPRGDASFSRLHNFHVALRQGSLLTEPWTAVLIRVFAKTGALLLESRNMLVFDHAMDGNETFRRADDCVRALWYLGRRSGMAMSAAKLLGDALKERRHSAQKKSSDMASFLDADLWQDFEGLHAAFEVECKPYLNNE